MNIIFLDIDGVVRTDNSDKFWSNLLNTKIPISVFERKFDKKSISILNEIVYYTNAKVVISSSWKNNFSLNELKDIFKKEGFNGEVIDVTKCLYNRGEEIQEYLDTHNINKYVVIDDNIKDIRNHINSKRIIECDSYIGLSGVNVENIIDILC